MPSFADAGKGKGKSAQGSNSSSAAAGKDKKGGSGFGAQKPHSQSSSSKGFKPKSKPGSGGSSSSSGKEQSGSGGKKPFKKFDKKKGGKDGKPFSAKPKKTGAVTKEDAKRLKEERSHAHKHHAAIDRANKCWNELRERKTPAAKRQALVAEVVKLFKGKVMEVILRHDASRVVQGCLKFGSPAEKAALFGEMKDSILYLTKAKHGHHLVERLLRYGDSAARAGVLAELKGHMARLMTHNLGALVIEAGFAHGWSPAQQWELYQELYGPEYVHFKLPALAAPGGGKNSSNSSSAASVGATRNLGAVLAARPDKKKAILECLFYTLARQADKGLLSLTVSQRLLAEFLTYAPPEQIVAIVPVVRDQVLALLSSKEGAHAAALIAGYGTAKDRKLLFRALRGHMLDVAVHDHGHMALIAALHYTDDTKMAGGAVFEELRPHLPYLACHRYGRKVLLALLAPQSRRYFTAWDLTLLAPLSLPGYVQAARKAAGGPEEGGADGKASGKDKGAAGKKGEAAAAAGAEGAAPAPSAASQLKLPAAPGADVTSDPTAMALQPTSRKPDAVRRAELLAGIATHLQSACLTHTSVLARSKTSVPVLLEAALHLGNAPSYDAPDVTILAAIADLVTSEPSPAELEEQISAMGAAAAAASASAQARSKKLERALGTTAGAAEPGPSAANKASSSSSSSAAEPAAKKVKFGAPEEEEEAADGGDDEEAVAEEEGEGDEEMGEGAGGDDDEDAAGDEEDEEDEDDWSDDEDDDEEEGGAAAADDDDRAASRLPIFEDPASHLLFKWLLTREARKGADRLEGGRPGREADGAGGGDQSAPVTPVFGPLLLERISGGLTSLAGSNRACFILLELANSSHAKTSAAVLAELSTPAALAALKSAEASPGRDALLRAVEASSGKAKGAKAPAKLAAAAAGSAPSSASGSASDGGKKQQQKGPGGKAAASAAAPVAESATGKRKKMA